MASVDHIQLNLESETLNANMVKDLVVQELVTQQLVTQAQCDDFCQRWQVIIIKNGWFKSWVNKFKKTPEMWSYKIVRFE